MESAVVCSFLLFVVVSEIAKMAKDKELQRLRYDIKQLEKCSVPLEQHVGGIRKQTNNKTQKDSTLIILSQMKMSTEPSFDTAMFSHKLNKLATLLLIGMIEPAAAINDVIFL